MFAIVTWRHRYLEIPSSRWRWVLLNKAGPPQLACINLLNSWFYWLYWSYYWLTGWVIDDVIVKVTRAVTYINMQPHAVFLTHVSQGVKRIKGSQHCCTARCHNNQWPWPLALALLHLGVEVSTAHVTCGVGCYGYAMGGTDAKKRGCFCHGIVYLQVKVYNDYRMLVHVMGEFIFINFSNAAILRSPYIMWCKYLQWRLAIQAVSLDFRTQFVTCCVYGQKVAHWGACRY